MDVLVTYDVSTFDVEGERRLARVAKLCEEFGVRVQKSVFECRLVPTAFQRLVGEALDLIEPYSDSFNVYRFTGSLSDARLVLGRPPALTPDSPWVF
jgi:CRISPR-associated protein Cas2